jgi:hypothetical protein
MFEFTCILAHCIAPRTKQSLEWEYNRRSLRSRPAGRLGRECGGRLRLLTSHSTCRMRVVRNDKAEKAALVLVLPLF